MAGFKIKGALAGDVSGYSVSGAGDFNGDGISDVAVGAYAADPYTTRISGGISYVIFGSSTGFPTAIELLPLNTAGSTVGFAIYGAAPSSQSGYTVSTAGDMNGDTVDDLIIGSLTESPMVGGVTRSGAGASYVVFGRSYTSGASSYSNINLATITTIGTAQGFVIWGAMTSDVSGFVVSAAGDVNKDGFADVVIGAYLADPIVGGITRVDAGMSYVIFGRSTAVYTSSGYANIDLLPLHSAGSPLGFAIFGGAAGDQNGVVASAAGDINSDTIDDIVIGAYQASPVVGGVSRALAGAAYVLFGRTALGVGSPAYYANIDLLSLTSIGSSLGFAILGAAAGDSCARAVSGAGDFNSDGLDDVIVGSYTAHRVVNGAIQRMAGAAYVVFGRSYITGAASYTNVDLLQISALGSGLGFAILGTSQYDYCGFAVSGRVDINGDSVADVIVGSFGADPEVGGVTRYDAGIVYIMFGRRYTIGTSSYANVDLITYTTGTNLGYRVLGIGTSDYTGWAVSGAGDVNKDGIDDFIIGVFNADDGMAINIGASYVIYGAIAQPSSQPSSQPSQQPSAQPSLQPQGRPSGQPSGQPSRQPWNQPSAQPSLQPSLQPQGRPSGQPSGQPSRQPSSQPSAQPSAQPSSQPQGRPSGQPSGQPSRQPSSQPSAQPYSRPTSQPSVRPSRQPSSQPSTQPSLQPQGIPSAQPSGQPSRQPSARPTGQPSTRPSAQPSCAPSGWPSQQPSTQPTGQPSGQPTTQPKGQPTSEPSLQPLSQPTSQPSAMPSGQPSSRPSSQPSSLPSAQPQGVPSTQPSSRPSVQPSSQPTSEPSAQPSSEPSGEPSSQPSHRPSAQPSVHPSSQPSRRPTAVPSTQPSVRPSSLPTAQPSACPSAQPSTRPTVAPFASPSSQPSCTPTVQPSAYPSVQPRSLPSAQPTGRPSGQPSTRPSTQPSVPPSSQPTVQPSAQPSSQPSAQPSAQPMLAPTSQPTVQPSTSPSAPPTLAPTGEWATTVHQTALLTRVFSPGGSVWACGRGTDQTALCVLVELSSGEVLAQFPIDVSYVTAVISGSTADSVVISGRTVIDAIKMSRAASCVKTEGLLRCTGASFQDSTFVASSYVPYPNKFVHVGWYNAYTSITIVDAGSGNAQSYMYSAGNIRDLLLSQVQSPPSFVGSFVAGTAVRATATPVNYIVTGMVRTDGGILKAMTVAPVSGDIVNSADLVNAMALDPVGPDTFIAGGLQLDDSVGTHAYLLRVNALYGSLPFCVRYRSASSGGGRHALSVLSVPQSVVRGIVLVNTWLFLIVERASNNVSSLYVLKTSSITGEIVQQVHIAAGNGTNLHCTDITTAGVHVSIVCHRGDKLPHGESILMLVDQELSFKVLPVGFVRTEGVVFVAESLAFKSTVLSVVKTNVVVETTSSETKVGNNGPTLRPSHAPSLKPLPQPSCAPSSQPSSSPTAPPSVSARPTSQPSSATPTNTHRPTVAPSDAPTLVPSVLSTERPSFTPSIAPTMSPSSSPSASPTLAPTAKPSVEPSRAPVVRPSLRPTVVPSAPPSAVITAAPSPETSSSTAAVSKRSSRMSPYVVGASVGAGSLLLLLGFVLYRYFEAKEEAKARGVRKEAYFRQQALLAEQARAEHKKYIQEELKRSAEQKVESTLSELPKYKKKRKNSQSRGATGTRSGRDADVEVETALHMPPLQVPSSDSDSSFDISPLHSSEESSVERRKCRVRRVRRVVRVLSSDSDHSVSDSSESSGDSSRSDV